MRFLLCLIAALAAAGVDAAVAPGQAPADKKADKSDKQAPKDFDSITDIGGKTLDQWIKDIYSTDKSESVQALKTVLMFGPDRAQKALPAINEELKRHKGAVKIDASFRVNAISTIAAILTGSKKIKDTKTAEESLKHIVAMLKKTEEIIVKFRALQAVTAFGPIAAAAGAVEPLVALTKDFPTFETRQAAVTALGTVGQPVPKKKDKKTFETIEEARERGPSTEVTQALYAALKDKSSSVRLAAIQALSLLGVGKSRQKLAFEEHMDPVALKDTRPLVRIAAHLSLYGINKSKNKMRQAALAKLLTHPETVVRMEAVRGLGMIGPASDDYLTSIVQCIGDKEPSVGATAIWSIGRIGEKSAKARATLATILLQHPEPAVRVEAAKGLAVSGAAAVDQIPALLKAAQAPKEEDAVKFAAILTVANMGQVAQGAIPVLQAISANLKEHEGLRDAAKKAVEYIQKAKAKDAPKKGAAK